MPAKVTDLARSQRQSTCVVVLAEREGKAQNVGL
jgi:hypothetical protein